MNYNLVVEYKQSDKTGKYYYCLSLDLGYRTVALSFEPAVIAEILGVSVREIYDIKDSRIVGSLSI